MSTVATFPLSGGVAGAGGGSPTAQGRLDDAQKLLDGAITKAELLDTWRRVVSEEYRQAIEDDPRKTFALIRGQACPYFWVAEKLFEALRARYYRAWPDQGDPPASSGVFATATVSIRRTKDLDFGIEIAPGKLRLEGSQGRFYQNSGFVEWKPFQDKDQDVPFEAENPGFFYNLDFIAGPLGTITNQDGTVDTDAIDIEDLSKERTGDRADIVVGVSTTIEDATLSDRFFASDVGLYLRIDSGTNSGRVLRIQGFKESVLENPTGFFPRQLTLIDTPFVVQVSSAQADDGGAFTDQTSEARDYVVADDVTLLPAAPAVGDAYYLGGPLVFGGARIFVSTPGVAATDWIGVWEYFDGASYTALSGVTDATDAFRSAGDNAVTFTVPGDWATDTINSVTAFHIRFRLTTVTAITTQPLGTYAVLLQVATLTADTDVSWTMLDFGDLGLSLFSVPAFDGGRDDDLFLMGDDRGLYRQTNESDDAFRERAAVLDDSVTPAAINRAVNRFLQPFGETGLAFDTGVEAPRERIYKVKAAQLDDGGVFTDQTTAAQDHSTLDDMTLLPATAAAADAYYFTLDDPFTTIRLQMSTAGVGDWTLVWEYFDGTSFVALSNLVDPSDSFRLTGSHDITFDEPEVWPKSTVNSVFGRHVRARVTAVTTTTVQPLAAGVRLTRSVIDQFDGFFMDIDALDYYEDPTDSYPVNQFKLLLSEGELRGWFFVLLPFLSQEDVSIFLDDGPTTELSPGEFIGSASESGFMDIASEASDEVYAQIFDQLTRIRAGGHGFTFIRVVDTTTNPCP